MDQDATWYGSRPGPGDIVLDGNPAAPMEWGTAAPTFRAMPIVAKQSPISATAELLYSEPIICRLVMHWKRAPFGMLEAVASWFFSSSYAVVIY